MRRLRGPGRNEGFTLIELLVVIGLFGLIIGIATGTFNILLRQSSQQTRTAETQIEGLIGLELLRNDIEHAGLGLPWTFPTRDANDVAIALNYSEADTTLDGTVYGSTTKTPKDFNDAPKGEPRALITGRSAGANGSDILVIKGSNVARSETAQRWSYILTERAPSPKSWGKDDLSNGERVVVLRPNMGTTNPRQLVMVGPNTFYTTYSSTAFPSGFTPIGPQEHFLIYGVDPGTNLRMPFNRADYFISKANVPRLCAPNTGVLQKVVVNQSDGKLTNMLPLLDCVADIKFVFGRANNATGIVDSWSDTVPATALEIRQIKEVTVLILSHEGQIDRDFRYQAPGDKIVYGSVYGVALPDFDLTNIGANWQNYRWKVYRFTVKTRNLG